jgi:hypothetical protein
VIFVAVTVKSGVMSTQLAANEFGAVDNRNKMLKRAALGILIFIWLPRSRILALLKLLALIMWVRKLPRSLVLNISKTAEML